MRDLEITVTHFPVQCIWIGVTTIAAALVFAFRRASGADRMAALCVYPSILGCVLFILCFPIGHASPIRQHSAPGGGAYWSIWSLSFFPLLLTVMASVPVILISLFLRPPNCIPHYAARVLTLAASVIGFLSLRQLLPSA